MLLSELTSQPLVTPQLPSEPHVLNQLIGARSKADYYICRFDRRTKTSIVERSPDLDKTFLSTPLLLKLAGCPHDNIWHYEF